VNKDMLKLGWTAVTMEPCVWTLWHHGEIVAVSFIHVDDMVVGVAESNAFVNKAMCEVEKLYRWGRWEHTTFDQCGSDLVQLKDGTILQSLERATKKVSMIELAAQDRKGKDEDSLSPRGQTLCRAALGSLQFLASQGLCWLSAEISILAGHVPIGHTRAREEDQQVGSICPRNMSRSSGVSSREGPGVCDVA
jgi:hypothetical protein